MDFILSQVPHATELMTQVPFHLVTLILPTRQVAGHSCDVFSFSVVRRLQINVQTSWGCMGAEQRKVHPKLRSGLRLGCVFLWEGQGLGD